MIITGSALFVEPGTSDLVQERLAGFPEVTFHVQSASGTELVITIEAENHEVLEQLCQDLKARIPEIVEVVHLYVNFEEEIEKIQSGQIDKSTLRKPRFEE
jgi:nitrate reductase NapAB chaperone NapD